MTQKAAVKVTEGAKAALPWRKGIPWGWVLVEGIVMLGLGLFMVLAEAKARLAFGTVLSVALAVAGALQLLAAWKAKQAGDESPFGWIRGGIGFGVGLLMLILILASAISLQAARVLLGLGCLAYGGVGAYMLYLKRDAGIRLTEIISSTVFGLAGLLIIVTVLGGGLLATISTVVSVLLTLFGAFLVLWALVLRGQKKSAPVA